MKKFNEMYVIGIDHGYGNMKTANCCFPTGVMKSDTEPTFVSDLLVWNGKYYSIGVGYKEFTADKFNDEDYYVLTLAAIARELRRERITDANLFIDAGLPLTWVSEQKEDFKKYLLQNSEVTFTFRNTEYRIKIVGAEIYPQGFAAVTEKRGDFKGVNMLCDIGNGTMNLLRIVNSKPDAQRMFTEKYGTHQCALLIREQLMKLHHAALDDTIITEILRKGTADIDGEYLETVIKTAKKYTVGIFRRLREHEYNPKLMKLYVVGALKEARKIGAVTISLTSNAGSAIEKESDISICTDTGAEVITGSTRLKAGTAHKMVLNMLTTCAMVKDGKVYENMMINLKPSNVKLRQRTIRIVREICHCEEEKAIQLLESNDWNIRKAAESVREL